MVSRRLVASGLRGMPVPLAVAVEGYEPCAGPIPLPQCCQNRGGLEGIPENLRRRRDRFKLLIDGVFVPEVHAIRMGRARVRVRSTPPFK